MLHISNIMRVMHNVIQKQKVLIITFKRFYARGANNGLYIDDSL